MIHQEWRNDPEVAEHIAAFRRAETKLLKLQREGTQTEFFVAMSDAEKALHLAQNRLNYLRFPKLRVI